MSAPLIIVNRRKRTFGARPVFVERYHAGMDATVRAAQGFKLVYEDPEARIYRVE